MSYTHLSANERYCIDQLYQRDHTLRFIAKTIGRSASTICRELKRNREASDCYWCKSAERIAKKRNSTPRTQYRLSHPPLKEKVIKNLQHGLSPDIIAQRLKRESRSQKMQLSYGAIYRFVYQEAKQGSDLYRSLIRQHKKRRKQRHSLRRRLFENRVSIDKRPKVVDDKSRYGDWESDSVEGAKSKGGLATHVERKSRFLVAGKLKDKTSECFMKTSIKLFKHIDKKLIKTFTVDNGSEFAYFKLLEKATQSQVYFADPHSPFLN
jgi:IS30 family transposase